MGIRHYDRRNYFEQRISRFEMSDLMLEGMFVRDQGGRVWVNNANGYYTPQSRADDDSWKVITVDEVYRRAKIVMDGHQHTIARRRKIGGSLDRIKYVRK